MSDEHNHEAENAENQNDEQDEQAEGEQTVRRVEEEHRTETEVTQDNYTG